MSDHLTTTEAASEDSIVGAGGDDAAGTASATGSLFDQLMDTAAAQPGGFPRRKKNETDQEFLERLTTKLAEIPDAEWSSFATQEMTDWFSAAATAMNRQTETGQPQLIELPEGFESINVEKKEKRAKPAKAEKAPREAKTPKEKVVAGPRKRKEGFTYNTLRRMVLENPGVTVAELSAAAEEAGRDFKPATISMARSDTLDFIALVKETGHWQD